MKSILYLIISLLIAIPLSAKPAYPAVIKGADTVVYKNASGIDLKLFILKPESWSASDKRPAIVFYFGGGWHGGSPSHFESYANYYADKGFVTFLVDYRVRSRNNTPAIRAVEDAQDAFAFVRKYARDFGIDPQRMIASGGSAGGHLAAVLGTVKDKRNGSLSEPNAMVLFNPVCVVQGDKMTLRRLGVPAEEISPYHHIHASSPPTIIYHGTGDKVVPYRSAEMFHEKMTELDNQSILVPFEGKGHGFFNRNKHNPTSDYQKTLKLTDAFFRQLSWASADK